MTNKQSSFRTWFGIVKTKILKLIQDNSKIGKKKPEEKTVDEQEQEKIKERLRNLGYW